MSSFPLDYFNRKRLTLSIYGGRKTLRSGGQTRLTIQDLIKPSGGGSGDWQG